MSNDQRDKNARNIRTEKPTAARIAALLAEEWLGGYFVADHSACGNANIPNTEGDVFGWMNNRADWQKRNFVYANADVWADDFKSGSDHYTSSSLPAGFDGIESVVVGYISTHGVTSGNTFTMSTGGTGHGGCGVSSNQMSFGENGLRYMFFSTCQSVRNVRPGDVWFGAANGIRALFGYQTNSVDSDAYGKYFFENWKKEEAKTTTAFLDASWRISHDQIPVAAWFGPDQATADWFRDNEEYFQLGAISSNFISYSWYENRSLTHEIRLLRVPVMTIRFHSPRVVEDVVPLINALAHYKYAAEIKTTIESGDNVCHGCLDGTVLVQNHRSGSIDLTFPTFSSPSTVAFSDSDAIAAATGYVRERQVAMRGIVGQEQGLTIELVPTGIRHSITASDDQSGKNSTRNLRHVTVIFRHSINGVTTIGTGGVLEVTLNGNREVCRVRSVLRDVATTIREDFAIDVASLQQKAEERALSEIRLQPFVTDCRIIKSEFGYFAADESVAQEEAQPSFRILVEMHTGKFAKLIEKIYSARQIS